MTTVFRFVCLMLAVSLVPAAPAIAQGGMPDPKSMSGVPLPATDLPAGTVSVRLIRGGFDQNLPGERVEFTVDGRTETRTTDAEGRAQVAGLKPGAVVRAVATVAAERIESQPITVGAAGIRVILVATDPAAAEREAEDRALAASEAVKGIVVLGPESRVIAEWGNDRLSVFYILDVMNAARVPVDIGGPLIFDLPRSARGATVLEGSTPQATANGPRVTVTGPFAPGATSVQVAFELPYGAGTARLEQRWPATLQQLTILVPQLGGFDVASPQIEEKREVMDRGQPLIFATGSTIPAGQSLVLDITGLPYHARWPRYLALSLSIGIVGLGLWGAATARPRRPRA